MLQRELTELGLQQGLLERVVRGVRRRDRAVLHDPVDEAVLDPGHLGVRRVLGHVAGGARPLDVALQPVQRGLGLAGTAARLRDDQALGAPAQLRRPGRVGDALHAAASAAGVGLGRGHDVHLQVVVKGDSRMSHTLVGDFTPILTDVNHKNEYR